jgi:hypothetical protein
MSMIYFYEVDSESCQILICAVDDGFMRIVRSFIGKKELRNESEKEIQFSDRDTYPYGVFGNYAVGYC